MNLGRGWKTDQMVLDPNIVGQGLEDSLAGGATLLTQVEAAEALARFNQELKTLQQRRNGQGGAANPPQKEPPESAGNGRFKNECDRASYACGMDLGRGWREVQIDVDPTWFVQGLKETLASGARLLTDAEMADTLARFG